MLRLIGGNGFTWEWNGYRQIKETKRWMTKFMRGVWECNHEVHVKFRLMMEWTKEQANPCF